VVGQKGCTVRHAFALVEAGYCHPVLDLLVHVVLLDGDVVNQHVEYVCVLQLGCRQHGAHRALVVVEEVDCFDTFVQHVFVEFHRIEVVFVLLDPFLQGV